MGTQYAFFVEKYIRYNIGMDVNIFFIPYSYE